jgi:hypothetical protein
MIGAATDYLRLNDLTKEHAGVKEKLDKDLARWEDLASRQE